MGASVSSTFTVTLGIVMPSKLLSSILYELWISVIVSFFVSASLSAVTVTLWGVFQFDV